MPRHDPLDVGACAVEFETECVPGAFLAISAHALRVLDERPIRLQGLATANP